MKVFVSVMGERIEIPVGPGNQHIRWLALTAAVRYAREYYPHAFMLPMRALKDNEVLKPRMPIAEAVEDGGEIVVELRKESAVQEKEHQPDETLLEGEEDPRAWFEGAYGPMSNLRECQFPYIVDDPTNIPTKVSGSYFVNRDWEKIYPQAEYGGAFEIPLDAIERPDGGFSFMGTRKFPPGTARFKFFMEDGSPTISKLLKEGTITGTGDNQRHEVEFGWDVPIAASPFPDQDDRPSTASSADGAQSDPRFEQDWNSMALAWVDHRIRLRVKDVLVEFYAILIDLFDSYAFMGLDLTSASHTIGLEDIKHLFTQCELLEKQKWGIPWADVCKWYLKCSEVQDVRPYLPQRVTRAVYLEILLQAATVVICKPQAASGNQVRLDEGFFRFITEILIPVMDQYDEDPIRKDAVEHDNLIAIQQKRPSLRSIYSFLCQPWEPEADEPLVSVQTLEFFVGMIAERTKAAGEDDAGSPWPISATEAEMLQNALPDAINKVTQKRPCSPEELALYFWEFFEVFMLLARQLPSAVYIAVPKVVDSWVTCIQKIEDEGLALPGLEIPVPEVVPAEAAAEEAPAK
jgi:hypothetical protein